jgi:simple sugar transport system permease protein
LLRSAGTFTTQTSRNNPMNTMAESTAQSARSQEPDERVREIGVVRRLLARPEFGALAGAGLVFCVFGIAAGGSGMFSSEGVVNWMTVAGFLGILAVGAALLMIAGEFDLSVGSMIGFAGMMLAIPVLYWGWPISVAVAFSVVVSMALGWVNGYLVIRTGLPSFIVTLAFFFILRGLSLALSIIFTGKTIISANGDLVLRNMIAQDPLISWLFLGHCFTGLFDALARMGIFAANQNGAALAIGVPKAVVWWFALTAAGAFTLGRTTLGNWILASGGDANAAKNVGIPVAKVKIGLFMVTALCAAVFAILQVADAGSASADRGLQKEFEAIIAAVIGGCLLTGGYGSVIGAAFGALIFGLVQIGIGYTSIDNSWYRVFLGLMLLLAVIFNNYIRQRFAGSRH